MANPSVVSAGLTPNTPQETLQAAPVASGNIIIPHNAGNTDMMVPYVVVK
jgi:hypothetical protein